MMKGNLKILHKYTIKKDKIIQRHLCFSVSITTLLEFRQVQVFLLTMHILWFFQGQIFYKETIWENYFII